MFFIHHTFKSYHLFPDRYKVCAPRKGYERMVTTLTYIDTTVTLLVPYVLLIIMNAFIARAIANYNHRRRASYNRHFHSVTNHYHLDDREPLGLSCQSNHLKQDNCKKDGIRTGSPSNTDTSKTGRQSSQSDYETSSRVTNEGNSFSNLGMKAQIKVSTILIALMALLWFKE